MGSHHRIGKKVVQFTMAKRDQIYANQMAAKTLGDSIDAMAKGS